MKGPGKCDLILCTVPRAHLSCGFEFKLRPVCVGLGVLSSHVTAQVQALMIRWGAEINKGFVRVYKEMRCNGDDGL